MTLLRKIPTFFALCLFVLTANGQANLEFKLQLTNPLEWGVFVKPVGVTPSATGIMSTGQVTIIMPNGYDWHSQVNYSGKWTSHTPITAPEELPDRQVVSFWYDPDPSLPIELAAGHETLLFTIKGDECPDTLYLIDCITALANGPQSDVCPICPEYDDANYPANSVGNNLANNFLYFDLGNGAYYDFQGNYALSAWSCHDCDGDGIPNGMEDTNGNGVYDVDADSTNFCDPCDPYRIISATLKKASGFDVICAGDIGDTAYLVVDIEVQTGQDSTFYTGEGWSPYFVVFTTDGGTTTDTIFNYANGDTIAVVPTETVTYELVTVLDSFACAPADSLFGAPMIEIGATPNYTSISADDLVVCSGADTMIIACAEIQGGEFGFYWEFSTDNGATWDSLETGIGGAHSALLTTSSNGETMTSGCDTLFISDVSGMYDYKFRAVAIGCEHSISEEVQLRVEGPLTVLEHPQDVVECAGNAVVISVLIDNPGYTQTTYYWQVSHDNGTTWHGLSNNPIYGGVYGTELIIADVTGMNGYQFRLQADAGTCSYIHTEPATITSEGPIIYSQADDPQDVTVCQDGSFWFVSNASLAQAGTMKYQWQISSDDGINWTDITAVTDGGVYSGFDSPELYGASAAGLYNRCYRLAFSTGQCSEVYSNTACLNVQGEISITDQPDDIIVCSNEPAWFAIDVEDISPDYVGDEIHIKYQWQESTDGGISWIDLADGLILDGGSGVAGVNTDTFAVIESPGRNGHLFRAKVWTDVCDVIFSDAATFYFNSEIAIIDDPDDISVCPGEGVTFSAAVQNPSGVNVFFQWETSTNNGFHWSNASDGSPNGFSGVNTNQLAIADATDLYDHRFRLKAWTNECDTIWSNYALLTVEGPIAFLDQPDDATICSGEPVCFSVETVNTSLLDYQWQVMVHGSGTWVDLGYNSTYNGVTTPIFCISDVAGLDSAQFRVIIQTANCASTASEPALLTVEGPISFTRHPEDVTQCWGEEVYFVADPVIAVGNFGNLLYQWEYSPDGVNWSDISDGGVQLFSGSTTDSLIIGNVAGLHNTFYRLSVNTGVCTEVYSFDAELSVEGPLGFVEHPQDVFVCPDKEIFLFSKISNGALIGLDGVLFQWETSADGGLTWTDLYNGDNGTNIINGVESDSLLIAPATGLDGHQFRMKTWTMTCDTLISEAATVHHYCPESILLKLGYDPLYEVWSVFAAPEDGFMPTGSSELLSGRVTFAASSDFVPGNLLSFTGGDWEPGAVLLDAPENPGMNYFTFDLEPDGAPFLLENTNEVKLFSFKNTLGQCPDSLYLVKDFRPALVDENEVKGVSIVGGSAEDFSIGGYYGKAWNCSFTSGGINNPIDSLANGNSGSLFFAAGGNNDHMSLAPNPASDYLNVNISTENTDYQWLVRMVNLHGQSLQTHLAAGQASLRLDLNHLPTGLYFLSLERDGKVIQREKFMKE